MKVSIKHPRGFENYGLAKSGSFWNENYFEISKAAGKARLIFLLSFDDKSFEKVEKDRIQNRV